MEQTLGSAGLWVACPTMLFGTWHFTHGSDLAHPTGAIKGFVFDMSVLVGVWM